MCGIAGIVDYAQPADRHKNRLVHMQRLLRHRGPDAQGILLHKHAGLAHTRLALLDISRSSQPLGSEDGRWSLTYNGEVYNYRELRTELKSGWNFRTHGDTEVVLAAWAKWGIASLPRLNGMFAFFVWDNLEQKGWLVRDRLGVKPIHWKSTTEGVEFASEAKALVSLTPRVNEQAVLEYLAVPCFSGVASSMFAGIESLPPGGLLEISRTGLRQQDWGTYCPEVKTDYAPDLANVLSNAVQRTLIADVPSCTFLSGGFDSTLITALAAKYSAQPPDTYTITFPEQGQFNYQQSTMTNADDTPYAIAAAHELGLSHHLVPATQETLAERIRQIAVINDALPAWEQELAQHCLSQAASQKYKIVLVGDAADETHYGYHFLLDPVASASPANLIRKFGHTDIINPARMENAAGYFDDQYRRLALHYGYSWSDNPLDNTLATTCLIIKRWLPRLLHNGDIHTMNFSLEARVPFADSELLDLARRIPPSLAYRAGEEKSWLRHCSKGLMPEEIRLRKKSALPKDMKATYIYKSELRRLLPDNVDFISYFVRMTAVERLIQAESQPTENESALLFRLLCLCHWRQHYGVNL